MTLTAVTTNLAAINYGDSENVSVPASGPFELENPYLQAGGWPGFRVRVFINGGLISSLAYKQWNQTNYITLNVPPPFVDLNPGDKLLFAYTALTPPTVKWQPI